MLELLAFEKTVHFQAVVEVTELLIVWWVEDWDGRSIFENGQTKCRRTNLLM